MALTDLAKLTGASTDSALGERLAQAIEGPEGSELPALERLRFAAQQVGLRARIVEGTWSTLLSLLADDAPALCVESLEDGSSRCLLLLGLWGDEARIIAYGSSDEPREQRIPSAELRQRLDVAEGERAGWLLIDVARLTGGESIGPKGRAAAVRSTQPPLKRLGGLFRPDRGDLVAVLLFAVATGVLLLATPIAVQAVVNSVALGGALQPLVVVALLLFFGLGFAGALRAFQTWIVEILQRRLFVRMVEDLTQRLPRVSVHVYDKYYGPELVNRFFDIITIQKTGAGLLLDGLALVLSVVVGLVVLAFYHPLLFAFDVLLIIAIAVIVLGPLRKGVRTAIAESEAKYVVANWLEELARHPVLFRSSGVTPWISQHSEELTRAYLERRRTHYRVLFGQIVTALGLQALASTALLGLGGYLVIRGSLTLGQLVAAELIVTLVVGSVAKVGKHLENYYDLMAATDKVGKLLDLPVEDASGEVQVPVADVAGATLEVRDVTVLRPDGEPLLDHLNFTVEAGTSLGIQGPTGSGKSTLASLLWGLRRPDRGSIRLDGRSLRDLSLETLRRKTSLVAEAEVIGGTVRENVRIGRPFVTDDDVRDALERLGMLGGLDRLPGGLDCELNTRGWPLSGGELLLLQVARAIAGEPRLLIVSDMFLQLSGERRQRLLDTLFDPDAPWTLVVLSSAEDVLARCDQVLELPSCSLVAGGLEAAAAPAG